MHGVLETIDTAEMRHELLRDDRALLVDDQAAATFPGERLDLTAGRLTRLENMQEKTASDMVREGIT